MNVQFTKYNHEIKIYKSSLFPSESLHSSQKREYHSKRKGSACEAAIKPQMRLPPKGN